MLSALLASAVRAASQTKVFELQVVEKKLDQCLIQCGILVCQMWRTLKSAFFFTERVIVVAGSFIRMWSLHKTLLVWLKW